MTHGWDIKTNSAKGTDSEDRHFAELAVRHLTADRNGRSLTRTTRTKWQWAGLRLQDGVVKDDGSGHYYISEEEGLGSLQSGEVMGEPASPGTSSPMKLRLVTVLLISFLLHINVATALQWLPYVYLHYFNFTLTAPDSANLS
uniref:ORM1-like protein 2 n=1 Tax=Mesocestoides corti TaxID=53468 RepID=A0A5K3EWQ9_MESCO